MQEEVAGAGGGHGSQGSTGCQPTMVVRGSVQGTGNRHTDQASQTSGCPGGDQKKDFA